MKTAVMSPSANERGKVLPPVMSHRLVGHLQSLYSDSRHFHLLNYNSQTPELCHWQFLEKTAIAETLSLKNARTLKYPLLRTCRLPERRRTKRQKNSRQARFGSMASLQNAPAYLGLNSYCPIRLVCMTHYVVSPCPFWHSSNGISLYTICACSICAFDI